MVEVTDRLVAAVAPGADVVAGAQGVAGAQVSLCEEHGCCDLTLWRADTRDGLTVAAVEAGFAAQGYKQALRHPNLALFSHPDGHQVAWVVATGRLQIRLPLQIARGARPERASVIFDRLCRMEALFPSQGAGDDGRAATV